MCHTLWHRLDLDSCPTTRTPDGCQPTHEDRAPLDPDGDPDFGANRTGSCRVGLRLFDAATRTFFANDVRRRLDYLVAAPPVFRVAGVRGEPR
jgi:hypothetical protein